MLRGGGLELALRTGGAVTGVRGGVTAPGVKVEAAVRPFSTRISLLRAVDEAGGEEAADEFVFTKRCSRGSYAMEESLPSETARTPELASTTVLETRAGGAVATRLPLSAPRGGDFNVSHFCPGATGRSCELTPFTATLEKTPRSKFKGVFPF